MPTDPNLAMGVLLKDRSTLVRVSEHLLTFHHFIAGSSARLASAEELEIEFQRVRVEELPGKLMAQRRFKEKHMPRKEDDPRSISAFILER